MFIERIAANLPTDIIPDGKVVRCQFYLEQYSDQLFAEYDIPFPPDLDNAVPKRRAEFLAGRYCAQRALQALSAKSTYVAIGENRKPVWPEGIVGSISHDSENAIAIVKPQLSAGSSIGVDIEKTIAKADVQNMKELVVNHQELQILKASGLPEDLALTIIFSAKESFFKAVYHQVGEYFGFEEARLCKFRTEQGSGSLTLMASEYLKSAGLSQGEYQIFFFIEADEVLTLCDI